MIINATELENRVISEILQQYQSIRKYPSFNKLTVSKENNQIIIETDDNFKKFIKEPQVNNILVDERERLIFYEFFRDYFNQDLDWGILSGVKPVKLYRKIKKLGLNPNKILLEDFSLKSEKVKLLEDINSRQEGYLDTYSKPNHISIYLGIPICPERCSYCSFVSTILDKKRTLLTDYLENLKTEITKTAQIVKDNNLIIDSFYIGGGTPSVLNANEAKTLLTQIYNEFDLSNLQEFTYEAGRPETTSFELLKVLKDFNIDRVCLNPQSMNQKTLNKINRNHTIEDILTKYQMIRELGFNSVNMDLIVGLTDETEEDFLNSLDQVISLKPDNLTVHNLSIKRGSYLNEIRGKDVNSPFQNEFYEQVRKRLNQSQYHPYYLYRQKYTIGNGENIGYSQPGKDSLYNILMMAEEQSILGIGAGSSGKLYNSDLDRFNHVFTVKDIRTYNNRAEEVINKKIDIYKEFYRK